MSSNRFLPDRTIQHHDRRSTTMSTTPRTSALLTLPVATVLALAGCAQDDGASTAESATAAPEAAALEINDGWVKAADSGMTAAFGELANDSDTDVHIVSATSTVTDTMELHEMATGTDGSMVMRPKEGGFVVPAGGSYELDPGGDHLMFMDLTEPVAPGQPVVVLLEAEDGSTSEITLEGRSFSGADEDYEPGMNMGGDMGGSATATP